MVGFPAPWTVPTHGYYTTAGFTSLTRLIDRDKAWVKISAPYIVSPNDNLDDQEVTEIITALVKWAPERLVWGTNWPHLEKKVMPQ